MVAVPSILANASSQYPGLSSSQNGMGLFNEIFMAAQAGGAGRQNQYNTQSGQSYVAPAPNNRVYLDSSAQNGPSNPLLNFFHQLREQNLEDDSLALNPQNLGQLEEQLLNSGYSSQEVEQLLQAARQEDGSINLLALGQAVLMYPPVGGQAFSLNQTQRPLFAQAMQELGIASADIENYLNSAPRQGDNYLLRDIAGLLAKARLNPETGEQGMVDRATLQNLLQKLGLSQEQTDSLLNNNTQGANAREMFALLQAAANSQDKNMTQALQDLAQRSQQAREENASDAQRMQAHMIQTLQKMEARNPAEAMQLNKEPGMENNIQPEAKLAEAMRAIVENAAKAQSELGQQGGRNSEKGSPHAQEQADQNRLVENAAKQAKNSGQENALSSVLGVSSAANARVAGGAVNVLPAYVVRQVAFNMAQMVNRGQDTLRLELKPPTLGEISMELSVKDGAIKASMVAQTVAAKKALEAGMEQLKQQLAQQGLRVEQIEISVNPDAQRRHEQADPNRERNNSQRGQFQQPAEDEQPNGNTGGQLSVMA